VPAIPQGTNSLVRAVASISYVAAITAARHAGAGDPAQSRVAFGSARTASTPASKQGRDTSPPETSAAAKAPEHAAAGARGRNASPVRFAWSAASTYQQHRVAACPAVAFAKHSRGIIRAAVERA
jgi:hypothetical protein